MRDVRYIMTSMHIVARYPRTLPFRMDAPSSTVTIGDRVVRLTGIEFDLLRALGESAPWIVTYDTLLTAVWGAHASDKKNYLKLYVFYLRSKLEEDPSRPSLILNERQRGYRLALPS